MVTRKQVMATQPWGPSQHAAFPLPVRVAMYRRVIGHLRLIDVADRTYRQDTELLTAINEAALITGDFAGSARTLLAHLSALLEECLHA